MLGKAVAISLLAAIVLLVVLWQTTTPAAIGPLGILTVFILMYMSVLGILTFLLFGISKVVSKVSALFMTRRPIGALTLGRSYYFSSVIALAPVMLVGMQSVGEVGIYDVLLVGLFIVIACIYIFKRTS